jgi:F0F1-type ATP synthase epsilon subunit
LTVAELLRLRVWSPAESLVDVQDVLWVHVELSQVRPLTIWPGHAPLLAETAGEGLRYADEAGTHMVVLPPGMLQVSGNEVLILVGSGELQGASEDGDERFERLTDALLAAAGSVS